MNAFTLQTLDMSAIDVTDATPWTAAGGEPLRCCLRDAKDGESLVLVNYRPELPEGSPYQETGAVFVHTDGCTGPSSLTEYPADFYGRSQVLRAYDERGWIHPASRTHDGTDPEQAIASVLAEPGVVAIHSRNVVYGCFMFAITR
jgi:uncharacterized protein DUF1203